MTINLVNFTCTGSMTFDGEGREDIELDFLNYVRDTYPELSDFTIVTVTEIE